MIRLLELHLTHSHSESASSGGDGAKGPGREKVPRPKLGSELSEDDWSYWLTRWADYKRVAKIKPGDERMS